MLKVLALETEGTSKPTILLTGEGDPLRIEAGNTPQMYATRGLRIHEGKGDKKGKIVRGIKFSPTTITLYVHNGGTDPMIKTFAVATLEDWVYTLEEGENLLLSQVT